MTPPGADDITVTHVTIVSDCSSVGYSAFYGCTGLPLHFTLAADSSRVAIDGTMTITPLFFPGDASLACQWSSAAHQFAEAKGMTWVCE